MLILTRHIGQSIIINKDIEIVFLENKFGKQFKVGVIAPTDVVVDRSEIHQRKIEENKTGVRYVKSKLSNGWKDNHIAGNRGNR
jgi:carbon storage regulator CsrA